MLGMIVGLGQTSGFIRITDRGRVLDGVGDGPDIVPLVQGLRNPATLDPLQELAILAMDDVDPLARIGLPYDLQRLLLLLGEGVAEWLPSYLRRSH